MFGCRENSSVKVSSLLAKHLARPGLGHAIPSELQRTFAASGTSWFLFQMKKACSGPGARRSPQDTCSGLEEHRQRRLPWLKANGSLLFSPRALHSPNTLVPTEASAFWYRISGEQEWTERSFDKGKTLHHWNKS